MLLRITQEFIQNSLKHSRCENISIRLMTSDANLWALTLRDDGTGFDTSHTLSNGIGLTNMKNRAEIIGADFNLESTPNEGTILTMTLKRQP
ncbi:sensor histidine kinase [Chryseobacterium camelliae]|nr:ATP-binding protein [Chryseobacterium camelliae]MDQ1098730.1 signal transduction histidine kinase [Chryseobacterium camelliae]